MKVRELYTTMIVESVADVVKALRTKYPEPNQLDYINSNLTWIRQTFPKGAEWYMLLIGAQMSGDQNKLQQRLGQYNATNFENLQQELAHFSTLDYQPIKDYAFNNKPVSTVFTELTALEAKWKLLPSRPVTPQSDDWVLKDFGNGMQWWFVNRGYCDDEGRSGKHCGNVNGKQNTNERIMSLRHNLRVLLTFILLPTGFLGEMKATGNQKPDFKYHPYIMHLLLSETIKGITGAGWGPEFNFSIFDLDDDNLTQIMQQRPTFINDQIAATPREILKAPDIIKTNPTYQQLAVDEDPILANFFVNGKINNSTEAWERAIADNPNYIVYAPNTVSNYKERIIAKLSKNPSLLLEAPRSVLKDRSIIEEVIRKNPSAIQHIIPAILTYDLCKIAVTNDGWALEYVPEDFRTPEIYKIAVNTNGRALRDVPEEFRTPELCKIAVNNHGWALSSVPEDFRTPELCKIAVNNHGDALEYVPEEFRTPEIYKIAVNNNGRALRYVPADLRTPELCKIAVTNNGEALSSVPEDFRTPELCKIAVTNDGRALRYVPAELKTLELCKIAVNNNGWALSSVPAELKTPEIYKIAVTNNGRALEDVPEEFRTPELCKIAVNNNHGYALQYVPKDFRTPELCKIAVTNNGRALGYVPEEFRTPELCKIAVNNNGWALGDVPEELKQSNDYFELCKLAVTNGFKDPDDEYTPMQLLIDQEADLYLTPAQLRQLKDN